MSRIYSQTAPRQALRWLAGALLFADAPLLGHLALWPPLMFAAAVVVSLRMQTQGQRLRSLLWKLLGFALGGAAVMATYGTIAGLEPGLALLLVLMSLKVLEAHTPRDFHVLVLLGFFLCLTALFFNQGLLICLYVGLVSAMLTATLVRFHRGGDARQPFWPAARTTGMIMLQALPLVVVFFVLFPRVYGGFRMPLAPALTGLTGMPERLAPGTIASVVKSNELAFRANFPDTPVPPASSLYWRAGVMWMGDGLSWSPGPGLPGTWPDERLGGELIRQEIVMQPHGGRWVFALDWPAEAVEKATLEPGRVLRSRSPVYAQRRYTVYSRPESREMLLSAPMRVMSLQLRSQPSERVAALVASWRAAGADDPAVVNAALQFFRRENFRYTLTPGTYGGDALESFLFERRVGFCEHYAAAFATLMRVARIPARVVIGYQGGELNDARFGPYVIVRQADAHAWCEVWLQDRGWERVDPTTVVAPGRISFGAQSFLSSGADSAAGTTGAEGSAGATGLREILREVQLAWDSVSYQWDLRVLNFDEEAQRTFFASLGFEKVGQSALLAWTVIASVALLALLGLLLRRLARAPRDRVQEAWLRFCRRLARHGVRRGEAEGPLDFCARASAALPEQAPAIRAEGERYVAERYGA